MPGKNKKQWRFIKKGTSTSSAQQPLPSSMGTPSWSIYQNITELPLSRWMDLTIDGYTKALVKEGNPPADALIKAEHQIRIQYADARGDHHYRMYINLMNEIGVLEISLNQINFIINTLRTVYQPLLAKELNILLTTSFVFDVKNAEAYDKMLDRCANRAKGIKINLDLKTIAFKKLEEKYQTGANTNATREYYMGALIVLSDDAGYPLPDSITVWEFLERVRRYNKKNEPKLKPVKNGRGFNK